MILARFSLRLPLFTLRVDFQSDGMTTILWGESGAGKTSILDCITGLRTPDSGEIVLDGRILFSSLRGIDLPPRERRIGYVFQDYALFPHLTAEGNVALALPPRERHRARMYLERFGLGRLGSHRPGELSGGERQRLALARAIAIEPQILLLDEPFSALDRATREVTYREFLDLRDSLGIPAILVTHSRSEAALLGQRVIEIREETVGSDGYERIASEAKERVWALK
jgi:molybdate transport system ATP-binding protein